jgi:hypothetical protein
MSPGGIWWNVATLASAVTLTACPGASRTATPMDLTPPIRPMTVTRLRSQMRRTASGPDPANPWRLGMTTTVCCCSAPVSYRPDRNGPKSPAARRCSRQASSRRTSARRLARPMAARRTAGCPTAVGGTAVRRTAGCRMAGCRMAARRTAPRTAGCLTAGCLTAGCRTAPPCRGVSTGCQTAAGFPPGRIAFTVLRCRVRQAEHLAGIAAPRLPRSRHPRSRTVSATTGDGRLRLSIPRCPAPSLRAGRTRAPRVRALIPLTAASA